MRDYGVVVMCSALLGACGDDGMSTGDDVVDPGATVTMQVLNGATPSASARPTHGTTRAADGNWQVSPNELRATLAELHFFGGSNGAMIPLTDCVVGFDLDEPGLAQQIECGFTLPAGTWDTVMPRYAGQYEVLIDDPVNGIFTDPSSTTKLSETEPIGGAQPILVGPTEPFYGGGGARFEPPLIVNDGDELTISILLNALQSFQISANAGTLELGVDGNGSPGFPDSVVSVDVPAGVWFFVNDVLGTPLSFGGSNPGLSDQLVSVSVLLGADDQPEFLGMGGANLTGCPAMQLFVFGNAENGYLGLDLDDTLGWAGKDANNEYTSLWRMSARSGIGETTTVECAATSSDPMPPGDSFASGAPDITPARTFAMTLMAN